MSYFLSPDWPAPKRVKALQTLRVGGVSAPPWSSLNLGDHVGDLSDAVTLNRQKIASSLPQMPCWLTQVHGTHVLDLDEPVENFEADAAVSRLAGRVCTVMTADCLPVLFCDQRATVVAAAHAGWRGLQAGVLEATVKKMRVPTDDLMVWLGPAIGPMAFEVGNEVRAAFLAADQQAESAFVPTGGPEKFFANLYLLARLRLEQIGIAPSRIFGGDFCTFSDEKRFFSYRRDQVTGRMATLIWLDEVHGV